MELLTLDMKAELRKNGEVFASDSGFDPHPVVKLFTPNAGATWLLAWTDPRNADLAFGLADLGHGAPELGMIDLAEIRELGNVGILVERDLYFTAAKPLSAYAAEAREAGAILA